MKKLFGAVSVVCGLAGAAGIVAPLSARDGGNGAVFALTNATAGNAVVMWPRGADGQLGAPVSFATGGAGSGVGLGSQGAVVISHDHQMLFAVNAGSNTISSFAIAPHGLRLIDVAPSGGTMPTSLTYDRGLLYVLNAGTPNNITGFRVSKSGGLEAIATSSRPLSGASTAPAQVSFTSDGRSLVVTERGTNSIDVYTMDDDGRAQGPFVYASAGPVPFGFAIDRQDTLLVSEAGAGGGASSYRVGGGGVLTPVTSMVMTGQRAACWAILSKNGQFGYVTNAGTGNISGFAIGSNGALSLLNADGVTATTGGNPTDMAMAHNGRFLYARVAALSQIAIFAVNADGSLTALPALTGTPAGLVGLAGF
jgi:6-phosphogluconolactonase (cycloisomerase 2 family)